MSAGHAIWRLTYTSDLKKFFVLDHRFAERGTPA
jgi:hypothetical protein